MGTVPRSVGDPDMASGGSAEERRVLSTDLEHHLADCALLVGRVPASGAECEAASAVALYYHRGRGSESDQVLPPPSERVQNWAYHLRGHGIADTPESV